MSNYTGTYDGDGWLPAYRYYNYTISAGVTGSAYLDNPDAIFTNRPISFSIPVSYLKGLGGSDGATSILAAYPTDTFANDFNVSVENGAILITKKEPYYTTDEDRTYSSGYSTAWGNILARAVLAELDTGRYVRLNFEIKVSYPLLALTVAHTPSDYGSVSTQVLRPGQSSTSSFSGDFSRYFEEGTEVVFSTFPNKYRSLNYIDINGAHFTGGTGYQFTLNENTTLTAYFSAITCVVTFDYGPAPISSTTITETYGDKYVLPPTPTWTNRIFDGWYTAPDGGDQVTTSTDVTSVSGHTLYAHWVVYYEIRATTGGSVEVRDSNNQTIPNAGTYSYGTVIGAIASNNDSSGAGYRFKQWSDGNTTTSRRITLTENIELFAQYYYRVVLYVRNNPTSKGTITSSKAAIGGSTTMQETTTILVPVPNYFEKGDTITLTATASDGYRFTSWDNSSTSRTRSITLNDDTTTVEANYQKMFTVFFRSNPDTVPKPSPNSITNVPDGSTFSVNNNVLTITVDGVAKTSTALSAYPTSTYDYTFSEWHLWPNPSPGTITYNCSFEARYSSIGHEYTLSYDTDGGVAISPTTIRYNDTYAGKLPTPTKTGYTFIGWYPDRNVSEQRIDDDTVFTNTANTTIYARWSINKYTVIWKNDDNSTLATEYNVPYGTTPIYEGNTPSKDANKIGDHYYYYIFNGWAPTPAPISGNVTYIAQFESYEATTYREDTDKRLYVFNYDELTWQLIDETAFVISFEAGGGTFKGAHPQIKITGCRKKDENGKVSSVEIPSPYTTYNEDNTYYTRSSDGTYVYIWAFSNEEATEIDISITSLPIDTSDNGDIAPPPGFDDISAWEMTTPYNKIYPYNTNNSETHITLNRSSIDNTRQTLVLPVWIPSNEDRLRAIIVASGLGSLDFGDIQSISTTYNSRLTTIPIVCHGYTGSYCMDLGVSKTISLSYIRVSPQNPNNETMNSREWDNATWVAKLKEFTDRWQMRTNGNLFYLKRPNNPRLANGYVDADPMKDYIEEINGENCYITSAPIQYLAGHPHMIKNTINLTMGTLYPKQTPVDMIQVTLVWKDPNNSDYSSYPDPGNRTLYLQYPKNTAAVPPNIPYTWAPMNIPGSQDYVYATGLYYYNDGQRVILTADKYFTPKPDGTTVFYALLSRIPSTGYRLITTPGTSTLKVIPADPSVDVTLTAIAIGGGGGGGGAGGKTHLESMGSAYVWVSGGAGGASGEYGSQTTILSSSGTLTVTCCVGSGGSGGQGVIYTEDIDGHGGQGGNGEDSWVSTNPSGASPFVTGHGGQGGPGAPYSQAGEWTNIEEDGHLGNGSYAGGNGGRSNGNNSESGTNGYAPSGQSNYGLGGSPDYHMETITLPERGVTVLHFQSGGGGGGGGAAIISGQTDASKGGSGSSPQEGYDIHGTYGSGGGGGNSKGIMSVDAGTLTYIGGNGGNGGNGVVHLLLQNGTFEED